MYQSACCPEDSTKSPRTTALSLITCSSSLRSVTIRSVAGFRRPGSPGLTRAQGVPGRGVRGLAPGKGRSAPPGLARDGACRPGAIGAPGGSREGAPGLARKGPAGQAPLAPRGLPGGRSPGLTQRGEDRALLIRVDAEYCLAVRGALVTRGVVL